MPSVGALSTLASLVLATSLAVPPAASTVSYFIGRGEVEELQKVVADQVRDRHPLGVSTLFGEADDKLVTLSQRDDHGRGVWHMVLFDLAGGTRVADYTVDARPLTWLSGPERVVLLRTGENAAYFVTLDVEGTSVWNELARVDLATGKLTRVKIPAEVANPRPFGLRDAVGVYSWNHGSIAVLKDGAFSLVAGRTARTRTVVDAATVSSCLDLAGVGILRLSHSGKGEIFDPAKPGVAAARTLDVGTAVADPQVATFEGRIVVVYGEAVPGAQGTTAIVALAIYDPVAGRQIWRKQLPWRARTFSVDHDSNLFRLLPLADAQLQFYDRKSDSFTKSVKLKPSEAARVVIVRTDQR